MPRNHTPSGAKNALGKAFRQIIDPNLTDAERDAVWTYFEAQCAYCGKALKRDDRLAHLDHLVPEEGNALGNRVLSCNRCNGDHKRELDWQEALRQLNPGGEADCNRRRDRILAWQKEHPKRVVCQELAGLAAAELAVLNEAIDAAVRRLRDARSQHPAPGR